VFQKNDKFKPTAPNPYFPIDTDAERPPDYSDDESTPTNSPQLRPVPLDSTPPPLSDDESLDYRDDDDDDDATPTNSPRLRPVTLGSDLADVPAQPLSPVRAGHSEHASLSHAPTASAGAGLPVATIRKR